MNGKQDVCFTCSQPIKNKLYEYERYRNVYGLSRTDAADKTQFTNICCRTTAFGQTGVEERVKAAGIVSTVNNEIRVQDIKEYPTTRVQRVKGEGPFKRNNVELAPNFREKINFQVFGGLREEIKTIPERRVYGSNPSTTVTSTRMSNRDVLGDLSSYPNGTWTLLDRKTFPKQEEMTEIFTKKLAVIHLVCPILSLEPLAVVEIPQDTTVDEALTILETTMVTPKMSLSDTIIQNNVIKAPKRLLHILKLQQAGKNVAIYDFSEFAMIVSKVYRDTKQKVYVFELRHIPTIQLGRKTLQEDWLKSLIEPKITKIEGEFGGPVVIYFDTTELEFTNFELHSKAITSQDISKIRVGSILEGVKHEKDQLLLSFRFKTELYVLVIIGEFEISNVNRTLLTVDEKRTTFLQLLDSL